MPKDLITSFWQFLNNSLNFIKMKKLQLEEMENVEGGKLTKQEIHDFAGAFECAISWSHPAALVGCAAWLFTLPS